MAKEVRCGFGMRPFAYQASLHLRFAAPANRFVTASWFVPDRDVARQLARNLSAASIRRALAGDL